MLLAIDIGNTNIVIGMMKSMEEYTVLRIASSLNKTADEYAFELKGLLDMEHIPVGDFHGAIVSSVVPQLRTAMQAAVKRVLGKDALVVGPGIKTGLNIQTDDPSQTGSDLVVAAVAVAKEYPLPAAIVDMGTATTITVLNEKGAFVGGCICPGMQLSLNALAAGTALLPDVSLEAPRRVIGRNTIDCMQSGLMFGAAAMLDGLLERMEQEYGCELHTVITGGLAKLVQPLCKKRMTYDDNLLLKGLWLIYQLNNNRR